MSINIYLSGGLKNHDPARSLGGQVSRIVPGSLIFNILRGPHDINNYGEAWNTLEWRCLYAINKGSEKLADIGFSVTGNYINDGKHGLMYYIGFDDIGKGDGITTGVAATQDDPHSHWTRNPPPLIYYLKDEKIILDSLEPNEGIPIWIMRRYFPATMPHFPINIECNLDIEYSIG